MPSIPLLRSFLVAATLLLGDQASAQPPTPILVELFTSEGCSSCPPADTLLRTLDSTQPIPGAQLIVLSEHVDYWDDLGWRDPYSSHAFTTRQQEYANRLGLASVYTPQMVVDGKVQFVRISSITVESHTVRARIETGPLSSKAEIFVALALEHATSQVLRGENGGHRLEHVAVVRMLTRIGQAAQGQAFSKEVSLALDPSDQPYRVIAFAQEQNQGRILGAAVESLNH